MANDRELIEPNEGDKRYVRRNDQGEFTDSQDDVGRSLSQDQQRDAKTETKKGQGSAATATSETGRARLASTAIAL